MYNPLAILLLGHTMAHYSKGTSGGTQDENQSVITRSGNVSGDVSSVNPGNDGLHYTYVNIQNDDVKSRDSDNPLGTNGQREHSINWNRHFKHLTNTGPTLFDIHGQYISSAGSTTTNLAADEAADDDGYTDNGEFADIRSGSPSSRAYPLKT